MKKLNNKKGFTLMEMLIVVAIIAILVAIAIPTFSNSLEKTKLAADQANVRSAYASAASDYMLGSLNKTQGAYTSGGISCTASESNGVITVKVESGTTASSVIKSYSNGSFTY